jgi:hypothetical protein
MSGFKLLTKVVQSGSKTCLSNGIAVARTAPRLACGPHSIVTTCKRETAHVSTMRMQLDDFDTDLDIPQTIHIPQVLGKYESRCRDRILL